MKLVVYVEGRSVYWGGAYQRSEQVQ